MTRFLTVIALTLLGIALVVFLLANRQEVLLSMDPFSQEDPALAVGPLPLSVHLVISLLIGFGLGAFGMYLSGHKRRRELREKRRELRRVQAELKEARAANLPVLRDAEAATPAPSDAARLPAPAA